ncbi:MAG: hypothetical protein H6710_14830 [Myxococcales bacterium]|nr:hypothetical protein [Myxococcales bacterium]MCB9702050.1 hypothetical protein [Myxococcales bacterium]
MRALRTLAPAVAVAVAYLGGAGEAHAWGGLALEGLVRSSTHLALHSCLTDVSFFGGVFAGELGGGGSCQSSWIVDFSALLFFFSTVVLVVRMRLRAEERRLELARRFVEQGMEPPAALFPSAARSDLRRGVVLVFAGLGLLAAGSSEGHFGSVGLIPGFIGLGYLVSFGLSERLSDRKNRDPR